MLQAQNAQLTYYNNDLGHQLFCITQELQQAQAHIYNLQAGTGTGGATEEEEEEEETEEETEETDPTSQEQLTDVIEQLQTNISKMRAESLQSLASKDAELVQLRANIDKAHTDILQKECELKDACARADCILERSAEQRAFLENEHLDYKKVRDEEAARMQATIDQLKKTIIVEKEEKEKEKEKAQDKAADKTNVCDAYTVTEQQLATSLEQQAAELGKRYEAGLQKAKQVTDRMRLKLEKAHGELEMERRNAQKNKKQLKQPSTIEEKKALTHDNKFDLKSEMIRANQVGILSVHQWGIVRTTYECELALLNTSSEDEVLNLPLAQAKGDETLTLAKRAAKSTSLPELRVMVLLLERMVRNDRAFNACITYLVATNAKILWHQFVDKATLPSIDAKRSKQACETLDILITTSKTKSKNSQDHMGELVDTLDEFCGSHVIEMD
jgi:hypothetical protein